MSDLSAAPADEAPGPPTMRRGRIAIVTNTLLYGGAEMQVNVLAQGLARRGWTVRVISMSRARAFVGELEAAGVSVRAIGMAQRYHKLMGIPWLVRELRRFRPDVAHSHVYRANLYARLARPFARVPVLVCTAHNIAEGATRDDEVSFAERAYRWTDRCCDLTTNVSRAAVERYVRLKAAPRDRIEYMANGIDTARFRPDPGARARLRAELALGDAPTWLAVGRFSEQKDHRTMVEAFALAQRQHREARLLLAGEGPLVEDVRALAAARGLSEHVTLLGLREDVPALLNAVDGYLMSSRWEGLPIVLLEAAATGLPIVTTDVGGNAEIVEDGVTGRVVPSERPDLLAGAICEVLALSPDERARMGSAGREAVEREYGIEAVLDRWEALYARLLARKGRAPAGGGESAS